LLKKILNEDFFKYVHLFAPGIHHWITLNPETYYYIFFTYFQYFKHWSVTAKVLSLTAKRLHENPFCSNEII